MAKFLRQHFPIMLGTLIVLALVVVVWIFSAPIAQWLRSTRSVDTVASLGEHFLALTILGACLVVLVVIWLPKWQATRSGLTEQARFEVENEARKTLAEIIGGAAVLAGLFFTWENLRATQESLRITQETSTKSQELAREGQITERFTKAIDHLGAVNTEGKKQLEIRLGGIYALERIARDSERDHWPVMEILTAYVRAHAPWPPEGASPQQDDQSAAETPSVKNGPASPRLTEDIQAILTVLGRRTRLAREGEDQRLNLAHTDLQGVDLRDAQLERAILRGARLERANLQDARLQEANLENTQLERAILQDAQLWGANLRDARLQKANLWRAQLQGANLRRAQLQRASLSQAPLQRAILQEAQLQGALLIEAQLQGANLQDAQLQGANLQDAALQGATLPRAQLQGAILFGAQLQGAHLQGAQLQGTHLQGAHLQGVSNLTVEQLCTVYTLYEAQLDPPLTEQIRQQCPKLLEKPPLLKKPQP